jgi:hypothetical protein
VKSPTFVGVDFSMNLCTSYVSPLNIKCMFGFGCLDILLEPWFVCLLPICILEART